MAERLRGIRVPTWILGLTVALLTFAVAFYPPGVGLDKSWAGGLYMAVDGGMSFGIDVVYTFGPLGFLYQPQLWFDDLAIVSFCFGTTLWVGLAISLVWTLRRSMGAVAAALISFVVLAVLPGFEQALAVVAIWCFAVLLPDRPRFAIEGLVIGGALFAAVESLIKLSIGPPVLAVIVIALLGARARPWQLAAFAGTYVVALTGLWLLLGGDLGDLVDYVAHSREIISGYSEAMGWPAGPAWQRVAIASALVLLVVGAACGSYRDRLARWAGIAIAAVAGFAILKEGVVRSDANHLTVAIETMAVLWLALPWSPTLPRRLALGGGLAALAVLATLIRPGSSFERLNPIETVDGAGTQFRMLVSPARRAETAAVARALMVDYYDVDARTLAELEGRSVSVDPWEIAAAWTYGLDWHPVPIFQGYQAYTEELDELNAAEVAVPDGPERILREAPDSEQPIGGGRGVDGRFAGWDPPRQAMATLCNFEPLHTTQRWQVLGRVPDRCGEPEAIGSVEAAFGETVNVPQAGTGEVVFARIEGAEVGGLEKLLTLLYRARFRYAVVNDDEVFRFVPGTASGPLLMNGDPAIVDPGPYADAPQARTIALQGLDGDLRYEFFTMPVTAPDIRDQES